MKVEQELWAGSREEDGAPSAVVATETDVGPGAPAEIDLDLEEAWEHRAELTDICRRIVGDTALAEDVVQETYLQAVKNLHRLERRDGIMPWLVTVATRRSLNEVRRRKYSTPVETMPEQRTAPETDPCAAVALGDEFDRVHEVLGTLTPRERDLLTRQVYQGLSLAELAEMEDSSPASVRSVLSRARTKIRTAIKESSALVLAPVAIATGWIRDRAADLQAKLAHGAPVLPAGHEKLTEMFVAGAAGIALLLGTTIPGAPASPAQPTADDAPRRGGLFSMSSEPQAPVQDGLEHSTSAVAVHTAASGRDGGDRSSPSASADDSAVDGDGASLLPEAPAGDDDPIEDPVPGDDPLVTPPDPDAGLTPPTPEDDGEVPTEAPAPEPEDIRGAVGRISEPADDAVRRASGITGADEALGTGGGPE